MAGSNLGQGINMYSLWRTKKPGLNAKNITQEYFKLLAFAEPQIMEECELILEDVSLERIKEFFSLIKVLEK